MKGKTLLPMLGLLAALPAAPALAQAQCGARDALVAILAERYGESLRSVGLAQNAVMEVYASLETGTWTIAVTTPDGTMCLVAAGQGFEEVEAPLPARGTRI